MFTGVPAEHIDNIWQYVEGEIKRLCDVDGLYAPEDIKKSLKERSMQLWVYAPKDLQALCVTEIITYPRMKICKVGAAGNKRDDWHGFMSVIEAWAREQGCDKMHIHARKGWAKVLTSFRIPAFIFEKELK